MCVCLSARECLCICVFADVHWEGVNCPLDVGVGREAGSPSFLPGKRHRGPVRAYRGGLGLVCCLRQTTPPQGATTGCCEEPVKGESLWLINSLVVGMGLGCGEGDVAPLRPAPGNTACPSLSKREGFGGDH